jgi:hypothetical protein
MKPISRSTAENLRANGVRGLEASVAFVNDHQVALELPKLWSSNEADLHWCSFKIALLMSVQELEVVQPSCKGDDG